MNHQSFHKAISIIVVALIVILTLASVANIYEQTTNYHHGLQVWLIAAGFAASFSVTVYIVMIAQTPATKIVAGVFALVFGYVSAKIQTELYITSGAPFGVALAYGYGVPGFEAALAILEAMLNMEMVKAIVPANDSNTNVSINDPERLPVERVENDAKQRRRSVLTFYADNPNASYQEAAEQLNVNKSVVWNDVKWLAKNAIVHVEKQGRNQTVTVNGNAPAFMEN